MASIKWNLFDDFFWNRLLLVSFTLHFVLVHIFLPGDPIGPIKIHLFSIISHTLDSSSHCNIICIILFFYKFSCSEPISLKGNRKMEMYSKKNALLLKSYLHQKFTSCILMKGIQFYLRFCYSAFSHSWSKNKLYCFGITLQLKNTIRLSLNKVEQPTNFLIF
ncbi:hypothetical protein EGR_07885 [Echinococcus granulosus]|uniref:Uncharacterized protein n=1 Tax=Echinococcus granulosus TaxID=6210 RepID=W6U7X4_ECHGR|nr:hypothetical protein EGR_07885 [Echinococcus granulosus]EUB57275.1 hypothetical protein EGR_07885 [Echinococcus granulosus]